MSSFYGSFNRELFLTLYFCLQMLKERVFVENTVSIRNECLFLWVFGEWIGVRNTQIAWKLSSSYNLFVTYSDSFPMNPEKRHSLNVSNWMCNALGNQDAHLLVCGSPIENASSHRVQTWYMDTNQYVDDPSLFFRSVVLGQSFSQYTKIGEKGAYMFNKHFCWILFLLFCSPSHSSVSLPPIE